MHVTGAADGDGEVQVWVHHPGTFRKLAQPKPEYKTLGSKARNEWLESRALSVVSLADSHNTSG